MLRGAIMTHSAVFAENIAEDKQIAPRTGQPVGGYFDTNISPGARWIMKLEIGTRRTQLKHKFSLGRHPGWQRLASPASCSPWLTTGGI